MRVMKQSYLNKKGKCNEYVGPYNFKIFSVILQNLHIFSCETPNHFRSRTNLLFISIMWNCYNVTYGSPQFCTRVFEPVLQAYWLFQGHHHLEYRTNQNSKRTKKLNSILSNIPTSDCYPRIAFICLGALISAVYYRLFILWSFFVK